MKTECSHTEQPAASGSERVSGTRSLPLAAWCVDRQFSSPCAALLTPAGRGAVAVVHLDGVGAAAIVAKHFTPAVGDVAKFAVGQIRFGRWRSTMNDDGDVGEELVVCRRDVDEYEIHCHGGAAASTAILDALRNDGCRIASTTDWLGEHCPDPIVTEALEALAQATTERTAGVLLDQHAGALRRAIDDVVRNLERNDSETAMRLLSRLIERAGVGRHCTEPYRVVLAGRPNVGKSSLINALVGYQRAIVFDRPGTTRDVVAVPTVLEGWPVELSDTAGLRESNDLLEASGIAAARRRQADADLVVAVFDLTAQWTDDDDSLLAAHPGALVIHNKADLAEWPRSTRPPGLQTSATTGIGIEALLAAIVDRLLSSPPAPGEGVPFTARQAVLLRQALESVVNGDRVASLESLRRL